MEEMTAEVPQDGTNQATIVDGTGDETTPQQSTIYTAEELDALHPTAIDLERVDPVARPIVEKTIKEYKSLQGDYTRKSQELSELKKTEEVFFEDTQKNTVFRDYLKDPLKVIRDINAEIANLESVIPDDGAAQYRNARLTIAQWNGIKDEFSTKRLEVSEKSRQSEIAEAKLSAELGTDATSLLEYAKGLGFSERDFKSKPELRAALKTTYKLANAANSAKSKEVKLLPHKAAAPSGGSGDSGDSFTKAFDPNISTEERIALFRKNKR